MTNSTRLAAAGSAYAAVLLVLLWGRTLNAGFLLVAGLGVGIALALGLRSVTGESGRRKLAWYVVLTALAAAIVTGLVTERRLEHVASDWDRLVSVREARLAAELDRQMDRLVRGGRRAAAAAATAAADGATPHASVSLDGIRHREGVAALAVIDRTGQLLVWTGEHRGRLPDEAGSADTGVLYAERPLVSYLYFTAPVEGRDAYAIAAVLLQSGLAGSYDGTAGFAERFSKRAGAQPHFGAGGGPDNAWSLIEGGDTVVHARFDAITQAEWRAGVANLGRHLVLALTGVALLFLALFSVARQKAVARPSARCGIGFLALAVAMAVAPIDALLGMDLLFSPALFLLPLPWDIPLGTGLAVLLPVAAFAAALAPRARESRPLLRMAVAAVVVAITFAAGMRILLASASPELLQGTYLWSGLFPAAAIVLTVIASLALPQLPAGRPRPVPVTLGLLISVALAAGVFARWRPDSALEAWIPALWAVPFVLLAFGVAPAVGRGSRLMRWLAMGWLATTVTLPHLWASHHEATLSSAERELATLGTRTDPFLDYSLRQFAFDAAARHAGGEDGLELLYRSWVTSGLARQADPARITLWDSAGVHEVDLVLGHAETMRYDEGPPVLPSRLRQQALATGELAAEPAQESPAGDYLLAVPLDDGRLISVVVPPRRSLDRSPAFMPVLGAEPRPGMELTLIHTALAHSPLERGSVKWRQIEQGWRGEAAVRYPDGEFHAHLDLRVASTSIQLARGILLLAAMLAVLTALWAMGRAGQGDPPAPPGGWRAWFGSFRARVTLALFAFFLVPTVIFGAVAYRALAGESERAARFIADRAVSQAVDAFHTLNGDLRAVAAHTGEEVLLYYNGELHQASSPEVVELGVYGAWMPQSIFHVLQSGEELGALETRQIGRRPYVIAYRPLPGATIAVPVSLSGGDAAARQREFADLILFAALLGGLLSSALSVAVGRALAGPIGRLRRAASAVGAGHLRVTLPEDRAGEFGQLFASFNQMARGLRNARAQELRTARVLAWGEVARQIAHGIKNPLTPIKLSVQHLRRAYADERPDFGAILDRNVEQILNEIDRLSELARAFSRYGAPAAAAGSLEDVDVASVIHEALTLYRAGEAGIRYEEEIEDGLPRVRARASELKEALLNLLENARAALEGGGTVTVHARLAGSTVELEVRDDGQGIPPELLPRIFEPHFSTRSAGTGLGLAIVRQLVESWGGGVAAQSEPGRGATIRFSIPVAQDSARLPIEEARVVARR